MRINGGILGPVNTTSNVSADGVWSLPEHLLKVEGNAWTSTGFSSGDLNYYARKQVRNLNGRFNVEDTESNPTAFRFSIDGTKLYVLGSIADRIFQYTLLEPYNLDTAFYSGSSLSITAQEPGPTGLAFDTTGSNAYITGTTRSNVIQYSLSVPWDIATGTFSANYYIPESPTGVTFSPNGTFMYVCFNTGDNVRQYTLSESWNVASATYDSVFFYIGGQETAPQDVILNSDGSSLYITGTGSDRVRQYNLSESYNVASASLFASSDILTEINSQAIDFRPDQSYLYVLGSTLKSILSYELSDPSNVATAVAIASVNTFSVASQDSAPTALRFNQDGTKMYMLRSTNSRVYTYNLSTPWDPGTATFESNTSTIINEVGGTSTYTGLYVSPLEDYIIIGDQTTRNVYRYSIPNPGNVSSALVTSRVGSQTLSLASFNFFSITGVSAKPDGNFLYVVDGQTDRVAQFRLVSPWNFNGATSNAANLSISAFSLNPGGLDISPTGDKILIPDSSYIYQVDLKNPWENTTGSLEAAFLSTSYASSPRGIALSGDGSRMYTISQSDDKVYTFSLPDSGSFILRPSNISNLPYLLNFDTTITGLKFSPTGNSLYLVGSTGDNVYQLSLSEPWNTKTLYSTNKRFNVTTQEGTPTDLTFSTDGTKMYIIGSAGDEVNEYSLSTPWDISTASFVGLFSVSTQDNSPEAISFKPDGTRMYIVGNQKDNVSQYTLSTPWSVNTASYDSQFYYVGNRISTPHSLEFNDLGTRMYIIDNSVSRLFQFELSESWNVATATFEGVSANLRHYDTSIQGVTFNNDYTKIYFPGTVTEKLYEVYVGP